MTFFQVLTAAINDFIEHGFDNEARLESWTHKLRDAAERALMPEQVMRRELEKALNGAFSRLVTKGGLVGPNVSKFSLDKLKPKLRRELDRRIMASANLIKLNRSESISNTLRRFQGWATSIPPGGTERTARQQQKDIIKRAVGRMPFEARRVIIDQTHKLVSNINDIVALDNGAIAARWHSHWQQPGYNYREDHKERDTKIYVIRGNWASAKGYITASNGYTDQITTPGEEIFCRCNYVYLYNLRQVKDLLTAKGESALQSAKIK